MPSLTTKIHKLRSSKILMQWLAAFAAFLAKLLTGVQFSWNSPNIARLTAENSPLPITAEEASWLISLIALGGLVATIIAAVAMEYLGSKKLVISALVLHSISFVCVICASSIEVLYAARAFAGAANCFTYSSPFYVGEIASPSIRGTLVTVTVIGAAVGSLFGTITETYIDMKISSAIYLVICVIALLLIVWLQNTPYYYVQKQDYEKAKNSIAFYCGDDEEEKIFTETKKYVDALSNYTLKDRLRYFRYPFIRKSMILMAILASFPNLSGQTVLVGYMETILISAKITLVNPQEFVIYANAVNIIISLSTVNLADLLGRRITLIISSLGVMVGLISLGTHFYLLKENYDSENLQWLTLFGYIVYLFSIYIGIVSIPFILLSELFPEQFKSMAYLVLNLFINISGFLISKTYQSIVDSVGHMYAFWMYVIFTSLAIPCALFLMPETKGKSFYEIQEALTKK